MPLPPAAPELRIGGLARLSSCDWPDQLVATVFCQGCSWRCRYCQNPDLQPPTAATPMAWEDVARFLAGRRGLLDGVVFSGGEPTLQAALPAALAAVRALGLRTGLHTAGPAPERLAAVLPLLDWVGFDAKAPFAAYAPTTGSDTGAAARESLRLLLESGVAYEVRTTCHPLLLDAAALETLGEELAEMGVRTWVVQSFRRAGCADAALNAIPAAPPALPAALRARFAHFAVR